MMKFTVELVSDPEEAFATTERLSKVASAPCRSSNEGRALAFLIWNISRLLIVEDIIIQKIEEMSIEFCQPLTRQGHYKIRFASWATGVDLDKEHLFGYFPEKVTLTGPNSFNNSNST